MNTTIGITGAAGLIGWHLRCCLHNRPGLAVQCLDREGFASRDRLRALAANCDVIVHLAGMNRGDDHVVHDTNIAIVDRLIDACRSAGAAPHILFASSTHIYRDTAYGASKRACTERLSQWAENNGARFANLVLPNIFGEHGRPFYNSVVSTFCHQAAKGETPRIIQDTETEQLHAQALCERIWEIARNGEIGEHRIEGNFIYVSALRDAIMDMANLYRRHIIPDIATDFDLCLFNTYRSYLFPAHYPVQLTMHKDHRGDLFEAVKTRHGGQAFMSTTHPGVTRGEHYHRYKMERFIIVKGEAVIRIRRLFSPEIIPLHIRADTPFYVDIPTLHTHNLTNTGAQELITLFWSHEIFNPEQPDTYPELVENNDDTI